MTDRLTQLLQTVLKHPADDGPRLVMADALEECGECDRAEFIRMQVELAAEHQVLGNCRAWRDENDEMDMDCGCCPACQLRILADELLAVHEAEWTWKDIRPDSFGADADVTRGIMVVKQVWHRGFIHQVECQLETWRGKPCEECNGNGKYHDYATDGSWAQNDIPCSYCRAIGRVGGIGPLLVRRAPIESVVVTDRRSAISIDEPRHFWDGHGDAESHSIPSGLWESLADYAMMSDTHMLKYYPSADAANAALSTVLLKEARETPLTDMKEKVYS